MLTCLLFLIITFFLLTVYSIIQSNLTLLHLDKSNLFTLKILDTASAATLFVTLLGALLVRHQFVLSVLPRINYKSAFAGRPDLQNPDTSFKTWRVEIKNTGLGPAIISRAEYMIELYKNETAYHAYTFDDFTAMLLKAGLVCNCDCWVENITPGFSLSPKDTCFLFEIKTAHLEKFKRLTMLLYFQGQLGDKYVREISLMPAAVV